VDALTPIKAGLAMLVYGLMIILWTVLTVVVVLG
jgi:hypothetical protein